MPNLQRAIVVGRKEEQYAVLAAMPLEARTDSALLQVAEQAIQQGQGLVKDLGKGVDGRPLCALAYPIVIDGTVLAAPVVEVAGTSGQAAVALLRQLQWGASQFENFHLRELPRTSNAASQRMSTAIVLLAAALERSDIRQSTFAVTTELATILGCERVSIGFLRRQTMQLVALSSASNFDKKSNMMRALSDAMDESLDQRVLLTAPPRDDDQIYVTVAQKQVLHEGGANSVCTVPLSKDGEIIGAMTLEHGDADFFNYDTVALCEQVAAVLGPLLELQRLESRPLYRKAGDSLKQFSVRLLGRGHYKLKLWTLALLSVVLFFSIKTTDYEVRAEATLEAYRQRHLAAAIDGYIRSADVRPGDVVQEGALLFKLDNKDLLLEREKWANQSQQIEKQYRDALQKREQDKVGIFRSQLNQANAQLSMIEQQLLRTSAIAPFDGVVIFGDLSQRLGSPVTKGETLMQIAPLNDYRVILLVDERDITQVTEGDAGQLALAATPDQTLPFTVEKVSPVSLAEAGVNRFRVEARLDGDNPDLRPGMQGSGKIAIGERRLIWVWSHRFTDWLKLLAWKWLP